MQSNHLTRAQMLDLVELLEIGLQIQRASPNTAAAFGLVTQKANRSQTLINFFNRQLGRNEHLLDAVAPETLAGQNRNQPEHSAAAARVGRDPDFRWSFVAGGMAGKEPAQDLPTAQRAGAG